MRSDPHPAEPRGGAAPLAGPLDNKLIFVLPRMLVYIHFYIYMPHG